MIQRAIPDFSATRILVAGDVMLDRYWHGGTGRISPEAPVPVVHVTATDDRPGGAGNVALGLAALGSTATLLAPVGQDEAGAALAALLAAAGVRAAWCHRDGMRTTTKLRVISQQQQMIRLDFEDAAERVAPLTDAEFGGRLAGIDVVVFSDYAKGALDDPRPLIEAARAARVPVLVDPKRSDFSAYRGATLLTPNRREFERVVGACRDAETLVQRARELLEKIEVKALLVTRGEEGISLISRAGDALHIPARARELFDFPGPGDTVIAIMAAALPPGEDLPQSAALANLGAGVVVGRLGTAVATPDDLRAAANRWRPAPRDRGVVAEAELLAHVAELRQRGDRIVMTNGCFDILHPGHVAYLEQARTLGDRLIVAVNDDAAVHRLKGGGRPVNGVAERMAVLAGLASVDWVVPFAEDTPARLIAAVTPDVLVKGGDYRVEQIAGHQSVLDRGGEVRVLPFVDGHSTTATIERLRRDG